MSVAFVQGCMLKKKVKCDKSFDGHMIKSCDSARWTSQKTDGLLRRPSPYPCELFLISKHCYFLLIFTFENSKSKQLEF